MNEIGTLHIKSISHSRLEFIYKKLISQDYDQKLLADWYSSIFGKKDEKFQEHMYFEMLDVIRDEILLRIANGKVTLSRRF